MYLSRIRLDESNASVIRTLSSLQVMHALVEGCFEEEVKTRKLWRIDEYLGSKHLMLLSEGKPDFIKLSRQLCIEDGIPEVKEYTPFLDRIEEGQKYYFRLTANPTYKPRDASGKSKLYAHVTIDQQLGWLRSKEKGFKLDTYDITSTEIKTFNKNKDRRMVTLKVTCFEGYLEVTDKESFVNILKQGIGRGKAYGCGLMTVVGVR